MHEMADNKTKTTTEVSDKEDGFQTEDNFESPLRTGRAGPDTKKDERRISSSSSSKSKDETRKNQAWVS